MESNIKINSAHRSNRFFTIPIVEGEIIPFDDVIQCCRGYFGFDGYLVVIWDTGYKTVINEKQYIKVVKYIPNNEKVFYLQKSCVKM